MGPSFARFCVWSLKSIKTFGLGLEYLPHLRKVLFFFDPLYQRSRALSFVKKSLGEHDVLTLPGKSETGCIFLIHGGAFLLPLNGLYLSLALTLREITDKEIILVDYPLLPENPFPHALEKVLACYKTLKKTRPGPVYVLGDSAGGNLALAMTHALKDSRIPLPEHLILFSPWIDLTLSTKSLEERDSLDPLLPVPLMHQVVSLYLGPHPKKTAGTPLVSPLYGDFKDFPPLYVCVGEHEVLWDEIHELSHKFLRSKGRVKLRIGAKEIHDYPVLNPGSSSSQLVFKDLKEILT